MRLTLISTLALAFLISILPLKESKSETLMECMTNCIHHEGGNSETNKATCKSRCGSKHVNQQSMGSGGKRDCVGDFKRCNKSCGKEKIGNPSPCHKECKTTLRTCN